MAFDTKYRYPYRWAPANDTSIGFGIADAQLAILVSVSVDWCLTEQHQYFTKNSKQLLRIYLNIDENMLRKFLRFSNTWRYFGFSPSQISTNIFTCGCFGLKINQLPANQEPQFRAEITFFYTFYLNQIQWLPVICVLINFDG